MTAMEKTSLRKGSKNTGLMNSKKTTNSTKNFLIPLYEDIAALEAFIAGSRTTTGIKINKGGLCLCPLK